VPREPRVATGNEMAPGLCGCGGRKAPQSSRSARGGRPHLASGLRAAPAASAGKSSTSWVSVSQEEIRKVIVNTPGAIEPILCAVRDKVEASRTRPAWLDTWVPSRGHGLCCVGTRARCLPMRVKPGSKWGRSPVSPCPTGLHPFSEALGSRPCPLLQRARPPAHL